MGQCHQCGNHYEGSFDIRMSDASYTFDSFECAIQKLAPDCPQCDWRIIGDGVQQGGEIFCCAHCAGNMGLSRVRDRAR